MKIKQYFYFFVFFVVSLVTIDFFSIFLIQQGNQFSEYRAQVVKQFEEAAPTSPHKSQCTTAVSPLWDERVGFRDIRLDFSCAKEKFSSENHVVLVGGSVMAGWRSTYWSSFERLFGDDGYTVTNLATPGNRFANSIASFESLLERGLVPRRVVFLEGFNEFIGIRAGDRIGKSNYYWHMTVGDRANTRMVGLINYYARRSHLVRFTMGILGSSEKYHLSKDQVDRAIAGSVENFAWNLNKLKLLCEHFSVECSVVLQPHIYAYKLGQLADIEKKVVEYASSTLPNSKYLFVEGYRKLMGLRSIVLCVPRKSADEVFFWDEAHLSSLGSERVYQCMK